jgi:hypothetical protein
MNSSRATTTAEQRLCALVAEHLGVFAVSRAEPPADGFYVARTEIAPLHLWNWAEVAARLADDALYAKLRAKTQHQHIDEFDTLRVHYCDTRAPLFDTYGAPEMDTLIKSPRF